VKILAKCPTCGRWVLLGFPHRVCAAGIHSTIVSEGYSVRLDRLLSTAKARTYLSAAGNRATLFNQQLLSARKPSSNQIPEQEAKELIELFQRLFGE
jgi:hypothetical protein